MTVQEYRNVIERQELAGVVLFAIIGVVLVALSPAFLCDGLRGHSPSPLR
jgi:hypothetical protein